MPDVYEPNEQLTVLMMPPVPPEWLERELTLEEWREFCCGYGISKLFKQRYGTTMLIRGILAWPRLVEQMGVLDRETAAD